MTIMKCLLPECKNDAYRPFKFCCGTHAYVFKNRVNELDTAFDADKYRAELVWYRQTKLEGNKPQRAQLTIEEIELYVA